MNDMMTRLIRNQRRGNDSGVENNLKKLIVEGKCVLFNLNVLFKLCFFFIEYNRKYKLRPRR